MHRISCVAALLGVVCAAQAQTLYVDYGTNGALPPTSGYPAAAPPDAASMNMWNAVSMPNSAGGLLDAETGLPLPVTITGVGSPDGHDQTGTTGNDQTLMDDRMNMGPNGGTITIAGLPMGTYSVYTYAWGPDAVSGTSYRVSVSPGGVTDQFCHPSATWPGNFAVGDTHTVHNGVTVSASNPNVTITVTFFSGTGSVVVNGFQILPQRTGQTYQGELRNGGVPVTGNYNMRFRLYGAAASALATYPSTGTVRVPVTNGLFTVGLDFGLNPFSGGARYLEVEVNGTTLTPRQELTPTPYALHARTVPWGGIIGAPACTPPCGTAGGDLAGSSYPDPVIAANAVTNSKLASDPLSLSNVSGGALNTNGTFVGIGTGAPAARLDVRGDVKLGPAGQYFAPSGAENLRIIRGQIAGSNGAIVFGTGFSASRLSQGDYRITFSTAFAGTPAVTVTVFDSVAGSRVATIAANSTASVEIKTWSGTITDEDFDFIAIGPR